MPVTQYLLLKESVLVHFVKMPGWEFLFQGVYSLHSGEKSKQYDIICFRLVYRLRHEICLKINNREFLGFEARNCNKMAIVRNNGR